MAGHAGEPGSASLMEKIADKIHGHESSSTHSHDHKPSPASVKSKIYRLFGREKPVHKVLGGGKSADIFLWRDKKLSASVLGGVTAIWVLFELLEYHLLSLVCHVFILFLAMVFLWSNASTFINKSRPHIPDIKIPEKAVVELVSSLRIEINRGFAVLRNIACGRDIKTFFAVVACLWVVSMIGSCCKFLTLFYILIVMLFTVPLIYEKYEDQIDPFAEKAEIEMKKYYAIFDAKVLSKIPRGALKDKKKD